MGLLRKAVSGIVGAAIAGAVNKAAHRAVVSRKPSYGALSRVGLGGVARRNVRQTPGEQVVTAVAGLVGTAIVNRLLRGRRRA